MPTPPFRIKICGVRRMEEIRATAAAGGDAVGLNFFPPSVRYVDPAVAATLAAQATRLGLCPVGVFVSEPLARVMQIAGDAGIDTVQLHGDETLEDARQLLRSGFAVIRAVRLPGGPCSPQQIDAAVAPWVEAGCSALLDADAGEAFGGKGLRLDWPSLRQWRGEHPSAADFILAGGLDVDAVIEAVTASGAWGVDVASGVESPRGVKSVDHIRQFAERARAALADPSTG